MRSKANAVTTHIGNLGAFLQFGPDCEVWFPFDRPESTEESILEIDAVMTALGKIKTAFEAKKAKGGAS